MNRKMKRRKRRHTDEETDLKCERGWNGKAKGVKKALRHERMRDRYSFLLHCKYNLIVDDNSERNHIIKTKWLSLMNGSHS